MVSTISGMQEKTIKGYCLEQTLHQFSKWAENRRKDRTRKKSLDFHRGFNRDPGNGLLSHPVTRAVPSALRGLTTVFGMGTGVTPSPKSPGKAPPKRGQTEIESSN
jgi:hypothetical protein